MIYKQFALTIAVSVGFSAFLALSFTPALCASFLKPTHEEKKNFVFRWFNSGFAKVTHTYTGHIGSAVHHAPRWMLVFVLITVVTGFLYTRLPTSFLPEEDQGVALAMVQLPPGASLQRTQAVMRRSRQDIQAGSGGGRASLQVAGFSFMGAGENVGMSFIRLKPWGERGWSADQGDAERAYEKRVQAGSAQPVDPGVTAAESLHA